MRTSYAIALGSNRRHGRHGAPAGVLRAAIAEIQAAGLAITALSSIRTTPALGPAGRGFANAAALIETDLEPAYLLALLKSIERRFGRRRGRRWGPRVLDLDIILWSQGPFTAEGLVIPHPEFRRRRFVLDPLVEIAADWRDPLTHASIRQLLHRLSRRSPVDRSESRS